MDVDVAELSSGELFEKMCNDLLLEIYPQMKAVEGAGGDEGVDSFVVTDNNKAIVFQYKFFPGRLNSVSSRKRNIISSLETAREKNPTMAKWVLLIATDFTPTEENWFQKEIVEKNKDIEIDYWNKTKIENEVTKRDNILNRYFGSSLMSASKQVNTALPFLTGTLVEKITGASNYLKEQIEQSPHLGLEYTINSGKGTEIKINPTNPIEIRLGVRLKEGELGGLTVNEYLTKILQEEGKSLTLTTDEITKLESSDRIVNDLIPKGGNLQVTLTPTYLEHEVHVNLEIPETKSYLEGLIFKPVKKNQKEAVIESSNLPLRVVLTFNKSDKKVNFGLSYTFSDSPIHEMVRVLDFLEGLKAGNTLVFREVATGRVISKARLDSNFDTVLEDRFVRFIRDLYEIELMANVQFHIPEKTTDKDLDNLFMIKELVTHGVCKLPLDISFIIDLNTAKNILDTYKKNGKVEGFGMRNKNLVCTLFNEKIEIGDVRYKFPAMKLDNESQVEEEIQRGDEDIHFEMSQLNDKDVTLLNVERVK